MVIPRPFRAPGFTLIELLVVLAIVATLLSLVAPRYFQSVDASKETVLRENLRAVRDMLEKFHADTGRYPESLEELVQKKYLRQLPVDPVLDGATAWRILPPPEGYPGAVYDIRSGAAGTAKDGTRYADW